MGGLLVTGTVSGQTIAEDASDHDERGDSPLTS